MVDFVTTQAQAKGAALSANREGGGQTEAKPLNASPPPTADWVDRLYRQLARSMASLPQHPMSPYMMPRRVPMESRRGASNILTCNYHGLAARAAAA
jgi:hypothetical protein